MCATLDLESRTHSDTDRDIRKLCLDSRTAANLNILASWFEPTNFDIFTAHISLCIVWILNSVSMSKAWSRSKPLISMARMPLTHLSKTNKYINNINAVNSSLFCTSTTIWRFLPIRIFDLNSIWIFECAVPVQRILQSTCVQIENCFRIINFVFNSNGNTSSFRISFGFER